MPDLDQIKQAEQGVRDRRRFRQRPVGQPRRPPGRLPQQGATIAAASLLKGEAGALTRKAVELALVGDPTALRPRPRHTYRFGGGGFRGRGRRVTGAARRARGLLRRLAGRVAALVASRQSTAMPIGIAAMPSAIAALATRSSRSSSAAMTTSASTRPAPNISNAVLV